MAEDRSERASSATRSTRTGYSSGAAAQEVRSMSEVMVDFTTEHRDFGDDARSVASSRYTTRTQGGRSVADRSGTEIVEYHAYQSSSGATTAGIVNQSYTTTEATSSASYHQQQQRQNRY